MKYEYKTLLPKLSGIINKVPSPEDIDAELNALGAEGWELVSAVPLSSAVGIGLSGKTGGIIYYFKRQKNG